MNLKTIHEYNNPFNAITDFEYELAKYTGARYVVTTDCNTHAIELCFRYLLHTNNSIKSVTVPKRTYLSVPMIFHKLGIPYNLIDVKWNSEYNFGFTNIWDSARRLSSNMYRTGQMQCLSFGRTKPLEIGHGGAILLDNEEAYAWLKKSSYDGRDLAFTPWHEQEVFEIGYHYMMKPEDCIIGLNKLSNNDISMNKPFKYPDLSKVSICSKDGQ